MTITDAERAAAVRLFAQVHGSVGALTQTLHAEVYPVIDKAPRRGALDEAVRALLLRVLSWGLSLRKLDDVFDFQAHSAGCRSLAEVAIDLVLLVDKVEPVEKMIAWEELCLLKEAKATVDNPAGREPATVASCKAFIAQNEPNRQATIDKWWPGSMARALAAKSKASGKQQKKKNSLPPRWTGIELRADARRADAKRPAMKLDQLMRAHYARLNWGTHGSGVLLARKLDERAFPGVPIQALGESFDLMGHAVRIALEHHGLLSKAWEEKITAARQKGLVDPVIRELEAIAQKAEESI